MTSVKRPDHESLQTGDAEERLFTETLPGTSVCLCGDFAITKSYIASLRVCCFKSDRAEKELKVAAIETLKCCLR